MWWNLILLVVFTVISILLAPKPKIEQPVIKDLENPTADAGRPIPVVFGTMTVKGLNVLWYGDKGDVERELPSESKK